MSTGGCWKNDFFFYSWQKNWAANEQCQNSKSLIFFFLTNTFSIYRSIGPGFWLVSQPPPTDTCCTYDSQELNSGLKINPTEWINILTWYTGRWLAWKPAALGASAAFHGNDVTWPAIDDESVSLILCTRVFLHKVWTKIISVFDSFVAPLCVKFG